MSHGCGCRFLDSANLCVPPAPATCPSHPYLRYSKRYIVSGASRAFDGRGCVLVLSSGSTGSAKCFVHAAAAASIMGHTEQFELGLGDRVGMVSNMTFDVSILETFAALTAASTLCIASQDETLTDLAQNLLNTEATHCLRLPRSCLCLTA
jgi:AMP-binding enzyme